MAHRVVVAMAVVQLQLQAVVEVQASTAVMDLERVFPSIGHSAHRVAVVVLARLVLMPHL
jgi:hypothetical protein